MDGSHNGWRKKADNEIAGLAIFDVGGLRKCPSVTMFRVPEILQYLERRGKGWLVLQKPKSWARNCDEYVLMGKIHESALIRWVLWTDLYASGLLSNNFINAFTLALYRQWSERDYVSAESVEVEDVCRKIVGFGKMLAGPRIENLLSLVKLILWPGIEICPGLRYLATADIICEGHEPSTISGRDLDHQFDQ